MGNRRERREWAAPAGSGADFGTLSVRVTIMDTGAG